METINLLEDIKAKKHFTFNIDSYSFSTAPDDPLARQACIEEIQKVTGKTYAWMKENTGNKHWVLYNTEDYYVSSYPSDHLQMNISFSGKLKLPINASSCYSMFAYIPVYKLDFSEIDTSQIVDMEEMFYGAILDDDFNPNFDTSNVKTMSKMFMNCEEVFTMDLSHFDVSKVKDFSNMFNGCTDLNFINLDGWNTRNAEDFGSMFFKCYNLRRIDLSHLNTCNVKNMCYMFNCCKSLEYINLSGWDFSQVDNMVAFFEGCSVLIDLIITTKKNSTKSLTYAYEMFCGCDNLEKIDISWLDLSNVKNLGNMFAHCISLTSLDFNQVNANKVNVTANMFKECRNLVKLNLTGLKMENLVAGWYMFKNCYNLKEILVTDFPNKLSDEQKNSMFENCGVACFTLVTKA